jgi:hypothetical protein
LLRKLAIAAFGATLFLGAATIAGAQSDAVEVTVRWDKPVSVSKTTPTLQVVVNPLLRRGSPIHDQAFLALKEMQADYVRFVPWMPYPLLGVAELQAPRDGKTFWDFSLIDPLALDFFHATEGHSTVINFSTIPTWMFKTDAPVAVPANPDEVVWDYEQGAQLRDPSGAELGEYYARLVSWYTRGGFVDEAGVEHHSGYSYKIPYWEVLNEPEYEHALAAVDYTKIYDAVTAAIRKVSPDMKFVGASLATPSQSPDFFEYFLNPAHHRNGTPLDSISYHFYATPTPDETPETQQYTFFAQADGFLSVVRYNEVVRKRLSPQTKTMINEVGTISAGGANQLAPGEKGDPIPDSYWNLSGALYAYLFGRLNELGIDVVGESQLVGYPTQFPSVTMLDWNTGRPNARYWVLKLLRENFGPGDTMVESRNPSPYVYTMAVIKKSGERRLLMVNKRNRAAVVTVAGAKGGAEQFVELGNAFGPPASASLESDAIALGGYSVAAITLPQ